MRLIDLGPLPLTVIVSLLVAVILLGIRVYVMQRVQSRRQRENRQETERLKSLVAAYRALAGSFTPAQPDQLPQVEEAFSDIILFGSLYQIELVAQCILALKTGQPVDYQLLVNDLRADLRRQLGLDPLPDTLNLPASGPSRLPRKNDEGGSNKNNEAGGGGGGMGGGGAALGAGGFGAGMLAQADQRS
jgi:uncharacterized membrane protein YgcG